jgi:hypothetical protein
VGGTPKVASDPRTACSGLVYRVAYRGEALNVYLLFEHRSCADHRALDGAPAPARHRRRGRAVPQAATHGPPSAAGVPAGVDHGERPGRHRQHSKTWSSRCRTGTARLC